MRVGFPGFLRRDKLLMGLVLQRSEISPKKKIVDCATCGVSRLFRFVSLPDGTKRPAPRDFILPFWRSRSPGRLGSSRVSRGINDHPLLSK